MTHEQQRAKRERVLAELQSGKAPQDVSIRHGLSTNYVRMIGNFAGIRFTFVPRGRPPSPKTFAILADLINNNGSYLTIAAMHGVTRQWVGQICQDARAAGIRVRGKGKPK